MTPGNVRGTWGDPDRSQGGEPLGLGLQGGAGHSYVDKGFLQAGGLLELKLRAEIETDWKMHLDQRRKMKTSSWKPLLKDPLCACPTDQETGTAGISTYKWGHQGSEWC